MAGDALGAFPMQTPSPHEITRLLRDWRGGSDQAQEELWPVIYHELRALAKSVLRRRGKAQLSAQGVSLRQAQGVSWPVAVGTIPSSCGGSVTGSCSKP